MNEVLPGVLHWTTHHEGIGTRVHSHFAVESAALIDPRVPDGGIEEVAQYGRPERILLSNRHHLRHSERFADGVRLPDPLPRGRGARVRPTAPTSGRSASARRSRRGSRRSRWAR